VRRVRRRLVGILPCGGYHVISPLRHVSIVLFNQTILVLNRSVSAIDASDFLF
jgi:hypothetical protein